MQKTNTTLKLVQPSLSSGAISILLTLYIVLATFWSTASNTAVIKDAVNILFERSAEVNSGLNTKDIFTGIFSNAYISELFYVLSWAFVGVLVYFGSIIMLKGFEPALEVIRTRSYIQRHKKDLYREAITRLVFRLFMTGTIITYMVLLVQILIPVAISSIEFALSFDSFESILALLSALVILVLSFHLATIFCRLFAMKVRIF